MLYSFFNEVKKDRQAHMSCPVLERNVIQHRSTGDSQLA